MPDSLFPRHDSNSAFVTMGISDAFATFLLYDECGPKISNDTAILLWSYGIDNKKELVMFSQLSIPQMLIGFPLQTLDNIWASDFIKLILYGEYFKIKKSLMIPTASLIDSAALDPIEFRFYKRIRREAVKTKFLQTFMRQYACHLDSMAELTHFDETNAMVQCVPSMNEHLEKQDLPIVRPLSHSCVINSQSNSMPSFLSSLTHDMMIDDSRRVTPTKLRGVLPSFASCHPDPAESANSDSDTDVSVSRKGEGKLMMDIPHKNLTAPTPALPTQNAGSAYTQLTYTELRGDNDELDKFYDTNSDCATGEDLNDELDKFYDTNSDCVTGEDLNDR
jgi:hypothetical protein